MILNAGEIARELETPSNPKDPLIITPLPNVEALKHSGAASLDIRLGCWFLSCRQSRVAVFDIYGDSDDAPSEAKLTRSSYVPFGGEYILHPKTFVLGVTLEWVRLPSKMAAYVVGRSSWGRHGLIIATATGVHPGFTGCLTLELSNIGETPIKIKPGTTICQLFIHEVATGIPDVVGGTSFIGMRKPTLGLIKLDNIARKLAEEDFH